MPSVTSDIKDLMSYQLTKFEKTTSASVENPQISPEDNLSHANLYENNLYQNVPKYTVDNILDADLENELKKCRRILFGSGGVVTIDKNHSYENRSWLFSTQAPSDDEEDEENDSNFKISVNLPSSFNLEQFLKTHRFSINIRISECKGKNYSEDSFIRKNRKLLRQTGWYYRNMDWKRSKDLLENSPIGTFLIRDSSDPNFVFSLSVQTGQGPISSRISSNNGKFQLDSHERLMDKMPSFSSILALVDFYTKYGLVKSYHGKQVWVDSSGNTFSPVQLEKPRRNQTGSLKHLARIALNKKILSEKNNSTHVPPLLKSYLQEYPYSF